MLEGESTPACSPCLGNLRAWYKDLFCSASQSYAANWALIEEKNSLRLTYVIFLLEVFYFILIFGKCFHIWIVKLKGVKKGSAVKVSFKAEDSGVKVDSWDWEQNTGTWNVWATQTDVAQLHQSNETVQNAYWEGACLSSNMHGLTLLGLQNGAKYQKYL